MSRVFFVLSSTGPGFPRVSGDEPAFWQVRRDERGFSPRERGLAALDTDAHPTQFVFPA